MDDTLTLMRLGITGKLAQTLSSTNPCESIIEIVRHIQRNVKRWQDGDMRKPWTAAGMLVAEAPVPADHRLPRPPTSSSPSSVTRFTPPPQEHAHQELAEPVTV